MANDQKPPTDAEKLQAVMVQNLQLMAENLRLKIGSTMQTMGLAQELLPYWQRELKALEQKLGEQDGRQRTV